MINDTMQIEVNKILHEVKNPLAICSGYLEMYDSSSYNKKEKYIEIISKQIEKVLNIISDYKTNTKKELINLKEFFEETENLLHDYYKKNNIFININCNKNINIKGNYKRLKELLFNILKNSEESKDKNILLIDIIVKELKENYKITIKDNGKGMSKKELKHIYDEYYTTKRNGTGLGVNLIKDIVIEHHGKIRYSSIESKGTIITLLFPKTNSNN